MRIQSGSVRIQPGYSQDTVRIQQGYSKDTVRIQQGYSQGTAGVQWGIVVPVGVQWWWRWEDLSRKHKNNAKTSICLLYLL